MKSRNWERVSHFPSAFPPIHATFRGKSAAVPRGEREWRGSGDGRKEEERERERERDRERQREPEKKQKPESNLGLGELCVEENN